MITPKIHLNGTSKDELVDQMLTVIASLNATLQNLADARPNGRDYYHTRNGAEAHEQHQNWEKLVERVREEIEQWIEIVAKEGTNEC